MSITAEEGIVDEIDVLRVRGIPRARAARGFSIYTNMLTVVAQLSANAKNCVIVPYLRALVCSQRHLKWMD